MAFSTGDFSNWSLRGEGGEAEIFRARQMSLDRLVAIKRLKLTSIGSAEEVVRFEREAKLCASLIHPNLVPIFDYGSEGKYYYLVMEFVHGIDLGKIADMPEEMKEGSSQLSESLKVHLARQIVEVVEFIGQKCILHRDLKPENFMADSTARIKLLDLGMARGQFQTHTDPTGRGLKGTLAYMPPEILRGQGPLTKQSEFYSLALVVLELFQGSRYYSGKKSEELISMIQSGIPLNEMTAVPSSLIKVLALYLHLDPARRPSTLEPLLRGLKNLQGNTIAMAGGKESLQEVIRREQREWLWAMVQAFENVGKIEEAFDRLRELLESDPDHIEFQNKFQELSIKINELPEKVSSSPSLPVFEAKSDFENSTPVHQKKWSNFSWTVLAAVFIGLGIIGIGSWFYFKDPPKAMDMGRDLVQKERKQLRKENEVGAQLIPIDSNSEPHKPTLPPYGILSITHIPKAYKVSINQKVYPTGKEIHLPASQYFLEIEDDKKNLVIHDSVTIGGGEPTVFDFQKKVGKR